MRARDTDKTPERDRPTRAAPRAAAPAAGLGAGSTSPQLILDLQRTAGNAAVTRMIQKAKHEPSVSYSQRTLLPIQRMRLSAENISFTNVSKKEQYFDKAVLVLSLLSQHEVIRRYLNDRGCEIVLEKRDKETPADVQDLGDHVRVTLAAHYFEHYDIGYIVGMLCHEFGIHPVANAKPDIDDREQPLRGQPFDVLGLNEKKMNSARAEQPEHVLGVIPGAPRYEIYKNVTLEMAQLLASHASRREGGAKSKDVTDLLDCFLMDVASIAATNDDRLLGMPPRFGSDAVRRDIATVYNHYRESLLTEQSLQDFIPLFPEVKTSEAVKNDFLTLVSSVLKGLFWASSISSS